MSGAGFFLWAALPYLCIAIFVVGHVWRYRRDQLTWTARSTQLLERRLLRLGGPLFHLGILTAIGGHVLGILIPKQATEAIGIHEHVYHLIALSAGSASGVAVVLGLGILVYRRLAVRRVQITTSRSDLVLYPLLVLAIVSGMLATVWGTGVDEYPYRLTVSPWFRGIFRFDPQPDLMANASFLFQLHGVSAWLLLAAWPFTRLVHAWSVPVAFLRRRPILYRARVPVGIAARRAADRPTRERAG